MKKNLFRKLIAAAMTVMIGAAYVPTFAYAADASQDSVKVTIRSQMAGGYLHGLEEVTVSAKEAENYGYTDSVTNGVSALDALVKAHELALESDFTKDNAQESLVVGSGGYVTTLFGEETSASGFLINQGYPNDGTESAWGGYNGTTVTTQQINTGDIVDFYVYQDDSDYSDYMTWTDAPEKVIAGTEFTANVTATGVMGGYLYKTPEDFKAAATPEDAEDLQMVWVTKSTGDISDPLYNAVDDNGEVTVDAPDEAGTYYLSAYNDEDEDCCAIMNPTEIQVVDPESADFSVTVSLEGTFATTEDDQAMINQDVTAYDMNMDGEYSIDEILSAAHEQYYKDGVSGYASTETQYGRSLVKLWGNESDAFGYWYNSGKGWTSANGLSDSVAEGGKVNAYVYADPTYWSDTFSAFTKNTTSVEEGTAFKIGLQTAGYDESWSTVWNPAANATIYFVDEDGTMEEAGTTDENGYAEISAPEMGTYYITAKKDGANLVPNVCKVNVVECDELKTVKQDAYQDLKSSYKASSYRNAELIKVLAEVIKGYENIQNATSSSEVSEALATAKANIAKIVTDAQYKYIEKSKVTGLAAKNIKTKKIRVTWKTKTRYDGYQVYYKKAGAKAKTVKVKGAASAKKVLTKLTKKKTYTVKVRGYKALGGKTVYGTYSTAKKVKVRK